MAAGYEELELTGSAQSTSWHTPGPTATRRSWWSSSVGRSDRMRGCDDVEIELPAGTWRSITVDDASIEDGGRRRLTDLLEAARECRWPDLGSRCSTHEPLTVAETAALGSRALADAQPRGRMLRTRSPSDVDESKATGAVDSSSTASSPKFIVRIDWTLPTRTGDDHRITGDLDMLVCVRFGEHREVSAE